MVVVGTNVSRRVSPIVIRSPAPARRPDRPRTSPELENDEASLSENPSSRTPSPPPPPPALASKMPWGPCRASCAMRSSPYLDG